MFVDSDVDLVARLVCAVAYIEENPEVFERVHQSMFRRDGVKHASLARAETLNTFYSICIYYLLQHI